MSATTATPNRLITAHQVADRLGLRLHRVYELTRAGQIPAVRLGCKQLRYDPRQLEAWIENGGSRDEG